MEKRYTDIAVVGGGPGGLAAALAAAQLGSKVMVFEKKDRLGGAVGGGTGPFAVETIQQRRLQRVVTKGEAFKYFMDYTHWQAHPGLVAAYVNKSADTIRWLEDLGCVFEGLYAYIEGGNHTWHGYDMMASGGISITDHIWQEARRLGTEALVNCPAVRLIKEGGAVCGVIVLKDGQEMEIRAKAVVISTGGFGNNAEMVRKYTPYILGETLSTMTVMCDGDGLNMAWAVGAAQGRMFYDAYAGILAPHLGGPGGFRAELRSLRQPNLLVNQRAERFTDETAMSNGAYGINVIRQQPGGCAYMIITDTIVDKYKKEGFPITMPCKDPFTNQYSDWPDNFEGRMQEIIERKESPDLFMADTIEALADQMGLDVEKLRQTVDAYNAMCDASDDAVFHKRKAYLNPIRGSTYYAARLFANSFGTLGGLNINERAEVLNDSGEPIRGLYAAGNDANTICLDSYCFGMPGHTSGFALNTGRIAGETAATAVRSI